ncbi:MAG: ATP-binding protein [Exilispira sp.]
MMKKYRYQNNKGSDIYSSDNVKFRIQKRIGYIFSIFIIIVIILNIFNEINVFGKILLNIGLIYKLIMLIEAIIFYLTTKKGHVKIKRILQIFFILLNGILTLYSDINQIYFGLSFLIFGSLLILQYDLFEHKIANYIILSLLFLICLAFIYNYYFQPVPNSGGILSEIKDPLKLHTYKIINIISRLIFIALFLTLFPSIYIDQANFYKNLNDLIIKEKESLASFANIGMMLNSTVHNFNNKIVTFLSSEYIIISIIKKYKDNIKPEDYEKIINTCQMVKHSSEDMALMVKDIRNLIKDKTNNNLQTFEVNKILEDIIKQFKISYEKLNVDFIFEKEEDPIFVKGNSIQFIQIIENLIKNSIESSPNPNITIRSGINSKPFISIKDNGSGIPFCFNCKTNNCINCKEFQIGKTTKENGSGTGMIYVQNTLKQMNGNLLIESTENQGTIVKIELDNFVTKKLEQIEQIYFDKNEYKTASN